MALSLLFWLLMLLWLILGAVPIVRGGDRGWQGIGSALLPFLAVAVLGWTVFGPAIQG